MSRRNRQLVATGEHGETEAALRYIRQHFITRDNLRAALDKLVNATFAARDPQWWGQDTACASDSKKFGSWQSNLMIEWHQRYGGPGVMIDPHVERQHTCIYSQLKSCSSSEVAAMIEGLLRHCTTAEVVETVSVTSGRMTLVVDGTEHAVEPGQTAMFDADAPHAYHGAGTEICHLIMTVHLPPDPAATI